MGDSITSERALEPLNPTSLPRRREITKIRRRLVLLGRHQHVVSAQEIILTADQNMMIVLGAVVLQPDRAGVAAISLRDRPGPRQGVVDDGDLVVKRIRIALVEKKALLHHRLVVGVKRHAGALVGARTLEAAGLDLQYVESAVAVGIDPFADREPKKRRLDLF